jgi:hypothetical protein
MVCLGDEAVDGALEFDDRAKDAALETAPGELCEEALDGIEPGAGSRGEVEDEARMAGQPSFDVRMLMGGVVVDDDMDDLADGDLGFDGIEEADELLMPVALHAAADDLAFEHVEGGEEGSGAVADIVVGHGAAAPLLDRQPRLGPVERLDLAHMGNSQVKTFGSGRFRLSWQISVGCFVSKV